MLLFEIYQVDYSLGLLPVESNQQLDTDVGFPAFRMRFSLLFSFSKSTNNEKVVPRQFGQNC